MPKIIFTSGIDPGYDDIPEIRCEFPERYYKMVTEAIGDWVIYYEPRNNGGRMSYYASARVEQVIKHPTNPKHYYMCVSHYLEFLEPVSFRDGDHYPESALRRADGMPNQGMLGWSVRRLPENEFSAILQLGFGNQHNIIKDYSPLVAEDHSDYSRPISQQLINRPFRDRAFSKNIHRVYDETCSFTGLKLSNDNGLYEVEAAHIRAVEDHGPDSPRNGLALGQTIHWLFDQGVLSLEDDGKILQATKLVPKKVKDLIHPDGHARFPETPHLKPHPQFLKFHRDNRFIG